MALTLDATSTEWVSVSEVMAQANIPSASASVTEVELMRDAAQDAVEGLIGPVLWRNVTETVTVVGGVVVLTYRPVVSFTSLVARDGSAVSYFAASSTAGVLNRISIGGIRDLTATYVAGRIIVPAAVRLATLIIAAHLWETQLGNTPSPGAFPNEAAPLGPVPGYGIPNRALDLLAPYMRPAGIA